MDVREKDKRPELMNFIFNIIQRKDSTIYIDIVIRKRKG